MSDPHQETIDAIVDILGDSRSVLFITGAGISADSGIPTYRGTGGIYDVSTTEDGLPIETVLSNATFQTNPELTWKYLARIADAAQGATWNRAHEVIASMESFFDRVWTLTQNVDGLHRLAGSKNVIEIHGNMRSVRCTQCPHQATVTDNLTLAPPPRCPKCETILRPNVVLFGEALPNKAVQRLSKETERGFDAIFSIGTSSVFPYIQEPIVVARRLGIPTIEINPCDTPLSGTVHYRLPWRAAKAMDAIWRQFLDCRENT